MNNNKSNKFLSFSGLVICLLVETSSFAQPACPTVTVSPNNVGICSGCTTLTATVQGTVATTSYSVSATPYVPYSFTGPNSVLVNIDDTWSAVVPIPFCFSFYGNTYTQCVIGSNAEISFDLANANMYNTWAISAAIPSAAPSDLTNSIMAPWHDIDPSVTSYSTPQITWGIYGTAPCRAFVVSWNNVSMFSPTCNAQIATSQVVLYETTSIIDIYIKDKPLCSTWNSGAAIEGIQNATGTQAMAVPGRNYPTQWSATNDGQRFTPTGAPQYTLTWYAPPNTPIGTALTASVCPTTTTTYTATVVNNTCSGPITVSDMATISIGFGTSPVMTYTPSACASNNGSAMAAPSGGSPPYTYLWSTAPPQNTQTAIGLAPGNYSVVVTDASGCSGTSTVTVTSTSGLVATATATPTNCTANVGTATANPAGGTAPYTFLWSPSAQNVQTATGLGAGTYTATITDANGCITTTTATVIAPNGITAVNTTATQTSCNGGTNGTATATPTGGIAPYTYLWNNGQTTQTATGFSAGTFSVTVKDANGCSFPATVTVTQPVAVVFVPSTVADTCGKKQGTASATVSGGLAPYTYMWLTNPVQSAVTAVGLMGGNYSCIITDANGCTAMGSASVANIPGPTANFIPFPQVVDILDANVYFLDLSSNANTWLWDFGDGPSSSTQQHPTHLYQNEGTFLVTLIVTSAQGCLDTISETVVVEGYTSFYVPNTFTPNGDGRNDFFTPVFSRIDSSAFSMQIFDRWGNEIFKTTTPGDYWDGRAYRRGPVVQEDVYAYVITYRDIKKQDHKLVGNVNVVK